MAKKKRTFVLRGALYYKILTQFELSNNQHEWTREARGREAKKEFRENEREEEREKGEKED